MLSELPVKVRLPRKAGNPTDMVHAVAITWIAVPREGRRGGDQRQRSITEVTPRRTHEVSFVRQINVTCLL